MQQLDHLELRAAFRHQHNSISKVWITSSLSSQLSLQPTNNLVTMASSSFSSFAIVGAGGVGASAATELRKNNHKVTILTRDIAKPELQDLKNRGATLVAVDYADQESLCRALLGSQVVYVFARGIRPA